MALSNLKKLVEVIAVLSSLILGSATLWHFGVPAYRHFKEQRSLRQAHSFFQSSDFQDAWLALRQVLVLNQTNVDACRTMADLAGIAHSPEEVTWRRRVAEIDPCPERRLELASCALHYEPPPFVLATTTLEALRKSATNTPAFHVICAERAIRLNRIPEAERELQEAMRLEPTNQLHALNLSVLRLQSGDAKAATEARANLKALSADPAYALAALRSLAADSYSRKDWPAALHLSGQVLQNSNSAFADRIQRLSILHDSSSADFSSYLHSLQQVAQTNTGSIAALATWLNGNGQAGRTVSWVKGLPENIRAQRPVAMLLADAYMIRRDWTTLQKWLPTQNWDEDEFVRLAILSRVWRKEGAVDVATANWRKALSAASDHPQKLSTLASLAQGWGWTNETEDATWEFARQFHDRSALLALEKAYYLRGNTAGLLRVYATVFDQQPTNALVMNNLATVSMLLKTNLSNAYGLAQEAYSRAQTNGSIASTYAFSLLLQGKTNQAVQVMTKLSERDLRDPSTALYYALLLSASGRAEEAKPYRALAASARLLPEERDLLEHSSRLTSAN